MKKKIAIIFPCAPTYREAIFKELDKEFDIDWFFAGNCHPPLKLLDYSVLKNVDTSLTEKKFGPFSLLKGIDMINLDKYDAVMFQGVFRSLSDLRLYMRKKGPKRYLWTHGWYGKETRFERTIKKWLFPKVDGIFLYGDRAKRLMAAEGLDTDKLHVIHNSLDYDRQLEVRNSLQPSDIFVNHFGNTSPNIIFIGRLTPVKKLDLLLDAVAMLIADGIEVNITLVGDGTARTALEAKVRELGIDSRVWFYGESFDELRNAEMIFNADICVSPGNVGLTAIHSLMFGCPVISNNDFNTQMPEYEAITPGKTGAFFTAYDYKSLAETIKNWLKSNGRDREAVRQRCLDTIDNEWNPHFQMEVFKRVFNNA